MKLSSLKDNNGNEIEIVPRKLCDANGNIIESNNLATKSELNEKANVKDSVYYVPGTSGYADWKANTAYVVGANVVNPSGECWTCKTAHTSGSSWSSTNWNRMSTVALTGTIDGVTTLYEGLKIAYRFQVVGGENSTTLNINNLGAKTITRGTGSFFRWVINRNGVAILVYDGTAWRFGDYDSDNVYALPDATCTTNAATQAKVATSVNFNYSKHNNILFRIYFTVANSYSGSLTLNVNSQGAKNLWINGSASSSSNMTIPIGVYWCYYDGTQFQLWTDKSFWALKYRGDGSALTETFTAASSRTNIATGESHATIFGKIAKWFSDLKALAFKDKVSDSDISGTISDSHIASAGTWNGKADKSTTVSTVAWDSTNKKLTKTINGATTDVVTASTLKTAMALDKVENKKITVTSSSVSDGTNTFSKYTHPTSAGNKHIPGGGSTGKFLAWSADGTATWADDPASEKANATHEHSASDINSGVLPIARGGTGATTANAAEYNLHQKLRSAQNLTTEFSDDSKIPCISSHELINTTNGVFAGYRTTSQIWNYIQSKISSVLGLTKDAYGGKAASATNADSATKATQDGNGANIVNTYATKEALGSVNQNIAGLTTGVNSKLEKDGSNATSTTTYNVLNAAAGGAFAEITDDEEFVTTYTYTNTNNSAGTSYKRAIGTLRDWILVKVKTLIHNREIQKSAISFHKQSTNFIPFGIEIPSDGLYGNFIDANIIVKSLDPTTLRGYSFKLTIIPQIWGDGIFRTSGNDTNYKTSMKVLGTANMKDLLGYSLVTFTANDNKRYLGVRVNPNMCIPSNVGSTILYQFLSEIECSNNLTIKFFNDKSDISNFDVISSISFPNSSSGTNGEAFGAASIETIQTNNLFDSAKGNNTAYSLNPFVKYNGPAINTNKTDFTITINTHELIPGMCYSLKPHRRGAKWNSDYSITLHFVNNSTETCTIYGGCVNGLEIVQTEEEVGTSTNKKTAFDLISKNNPDIELYVRTSSGGAKNIYIFGY